jgi:hypothetical protein
MADAPVTDNIFQDVIEEAQYQIEYWGTTQDASKSDTDWFWTLGHIAGKIIHDDGQSLEKQRHRIRAAMALLVNWERYICFRNGVDVPDLLNMDMPNILERSE